MPHSSPGRGAAGSAERHKAGEGAGGVDGSCGSGVYPLPDEDRTQASQGAQMARGDADEGGMAFVVPPELLGDLDTHALIQEQV
jgi:hypothetical protein